MRIEYRKELFYQGEIKFTGTGHVDMDAFDENMHTEIETVATFHDDEAERLCRPVLEAYGAELEKRNNDEPEADSVTLERTVIEHGDFKSKPLDISFFWGVGDWEYNGSILDLGMGFDPTDYGWAEDATDINDQPYDWNTQNVYSQIPKEEDFILVCQKEIAQELRFGFHKDTDGSTPEENADDAIEKMHRMIMLHRNLYNRDWDAASQKWFWE